MASIYILRTHLGQIDRPTLEWISVEMTAYSDSPDRNRSLEGIQRLLELSDAQLTALANHPRNPLGTKSVPKVVVPYLSVKLDTIGLLCSSKQKDLVNLIHYVEIINVKSAELADWNARTFEVTSNENHTLASGNADASIQAIIAASEKAVGCIKSYLS